MRFQYPEITDYGSIADHTFTRCVTGDPVVFNDNSPPPKDYKTCELDKFGECSCGTS